MSHDIHSAYFKAAICDLNQDIFSANFDLRNERHLIGELLPSHYKLLANGEHFYFHVSEL